MDVLNTFFIFNFTASIAVLAGFFLMRESASAAVSSIGKRVAAFNFAGVAGAATSMVLLASVAVLFR